MVNLPNWNKMERSSIAWKVINMISLIQSGKWQKRVTTDIFILQTTRMHHYKDQSTGQVMETPFTFAKKNLTSLKQFSYTFQSDAIERDYLICIAVSIFSLVYSCVGIKRHFCLLRLRGEGRHKSFAQDYGRYSNIGVNSHNHDPSHKIFPNSLSIELINSDLSSQNKSLRNSWAEQWSFMQPRKGYFVMRAFKTKGFLLAAL